MKKKVLFICTHNSARSQMAEGILNHLYGDIYKAYSAGTDPSGVNPLTVKVMYEIGIDISHHRSKDIEEFKNMEFDYIITVCDSSREKCPYFPGGKKYIHKGFKDPSDSGLNEEEKIEAFRKVRDEIKEWIEETFGKRKL